MEQRPHGEQAPDEEPGNPPAPGADLEHRSGPQHAEQPYSERPQAEAPPVDAEQLRQFQQFQEFQRFQRFQELQQQAGYDPAQLPPPPGNGQRPYPKIKAPRWLRWLGKKVLGWLIFAALTALALMWAYNYFLDDEDVDKPAAETGGGTYHTNEILPKKPYEAVRSVYDAIAKGTEPRYACGRFDRATQRAFATNLDYPSCGQAIKDLQSEVRHVNAYAESMPSSVSRPITANTFWISSCAFDITGGPALGEFKVKKVERGQWLIVGHRAGPPQCPAPSASTGPTR